MRPELGKTCDRPSVYPCVSPLISLYHTRTIFSRPEKLEDKPKIKEVLPPSGISWKSRRFNQADRRLRKCRPTEWSRALDRPTRWANDQEYVVSTEKTGKVKKQLRNVSWLNLTTHWGKFFERGFKNFKGEAAQHSDGCLDSGKRGQKRKFGFYIDACDSTLGQIFQ